MTDEEKAAEQAEMNPAFEEWWETTSWGDRMMYRIETSQRLERWAENGDAWIRNHPRFAAWLDRVTKRIQ